MAKVKISDLDDAATLDGTELVELEQDGGSVKCTTQDIADLGGGSSYLKYVALLSQTGTDAPTATVLQNTFGGAIVWTYNEAGNYTGTLAGAFTQNKTIVFASNDLPSGLNGYVGASRQTSNTVQFNAVSGVDGNGTDLEGNAFIEIRVYP